MSSILEICAGSIDSALAAARGGAQRIELCSALSEGGLTPSCGLIEAVRAIPGIDVNVLIRPRCGDFLYSQAEIDIMLADIRTAGKAHCDGVVIGALRPDGTVDMEACRQMIDCARLYGLSVTFHRAFDVTSNPQQALEQIIRLGCDRLLTSGCKPIAEKGINTLRSLVRLADDRISIMPGSGINPENVKRILSETGATEIHASARSQRPSAMLFRNDAISMGSEADEYMRLETDEKIVAQLVNSISELL